MRVLVAEPSRTLAALIRATLGELGCEIETVADGSSAMAAARNRLPDILLADVSLPGLDGYALIHAVRQLDRAGTLRAMLLAPDHVPLDNERLAYVGADDVLTKPFERAALIARLEALGGRGKTPARPGPEPAAEMPRLPERVAVPDDAEVDARIRQRVGEEVQLRLGPALSAALAQLLPPLVREGIEQMAHDRLIPTFERSVQSSVQELATPARVEAVIREALDDRMSDGLQKAMGAASARIESRLAEELGDFIRNELQKRLERQAEQVIWKVVPTLAETLVKEEIKRLTEP
jgi:DNA-binding response OmpR family regulator